MRSDLIKYYLIAFIAVVSQILLFRHLTFYGAQADIVLVFLCWAAIRRSRGEILVLTAITAFMQDALLDLWGLNMFTKTLTLFILHSFINRSQENRPLIWQVFIGVIGIAFLHNLILIALSSFVDLYATEYIIFPHLIGATIYTAIVGTAVYSLTKN